MALRHNGPEGRRVARIGKQLIEEAKQNSSGCEAEKKQAIEREAIPVAKLAKLAKESKPQKGEGGKDSKKKKKKDKKKNKDSKKPAKKKPAIEVSGCTNPDCGGDRIINLQTEVELAVCQTPVVDLHTHLYPPQFGALNLWGIDRLLTYHYLIAEYFRFGPDITPAEFFALPVPQQADRIWRTLFVENTPISEACRGVLTCLRNLGIDVSERNLGTIREAYADLASGADDPAAAFTDRVFQIANVREVVMTNDPFHPSERAFWLSKKERDPRYRAALRIDPLLLDWPAARAALGEMKYDIDADLTEKTVDAVRYFLHDWAKRTKPLYCAVSLPPSFRYPEPSHTTAAIEKCILPFAEECGIPFAMMIGVTRQVNPALDLAGDGAGRSDLSAVANLCAAYPQNRFMTTLLSRENQHELCVLARKFSNLLPFGCWWFTNVPSMIEEITRERTELLGFSYSPQHSDARVLDQLLYKWPHSRRVIAKVLVDYYTQLTQTGWNLHREEIRRDAEALLAGNFLKFAAAPSE